VEDVGRQQPGLPITIIAIPPLTEENETYRRAISTFAYLNTPVVTEKEVPRWAKDVADRVPVPEGTRR
jgi:hypothetical protein